MHNQYSDTENLQKHETEDGMKHTTIYEIYKMQYTFFMTFYVRG